MRVSNASLSQLSPDVVVPKYDRQRLTTGIVHIGVGGFHRAHQAVYVDDLCQTGAVDWGICGAGLLPHDKRMRDALRAQDCLYTVIERGADESHARIIGSMTDYVFAPDQPQALIERMAHPSTRIVSLTITEGGYCCDPDKGELDPSHPDIAHDLEHPESPRGAFGYLLAALARRRRDGLAPFTVLSCDNLEHNGAITQAVLLAFAARRDPSLRDWLERYGAFPSSMVDRITPGTTDSDRAQLSEQFGIDDAWPVVTEPFRQWVVEDNFSDGRPPWEKAGVLMTANVQPYELMKLRLLNASHSAMAYLGALAGFRYVHELMADERFKRYIVALMDQEVTPLLSEVPGVDLVQYKATLIERFANPTIKDQVERLCMDGSAKLPQFILPSIREQLERGGPIKLLSLVVAAWCRYLAGRDEQANTISIVDPMAATLERKVQAGGEGASGVVGIGEIFGTDLPQSRVFVDAVSRALQSLYDDGVKTTLAKWTAS